MHHHVTLSSQVRGDLNMWAPFLRQWNGASFFIDDNITLAADLSIYTDATPTSYGGFYKTRWFQGQFPPEFFLEKQSMALCELYPIVMAVALEGKFWANKRILFYCDNLSTVNIITKGRSKVCSIMRLMLRLTYTCCIHNFVIHAKHPWN